MTLSRWQRFEGFEMTRRLEIFISAGPDLEEEREAIGEALAKLPVSLGWVIKRTPHRGEPLAPALEDIRACDFYVFLLGTDITAPAGVEWNAAQRAGKTPFAFLKEVNRTPAAQAFISAVRAAWTSFHSPQELAVRLQRALAQGILGRAEKVGLSLVERETLAAFIERLERGEVPEKAPQILGRETGGAGEGGVIIAPGRDLPPGGVLVKK